MVTLAPWESGGNQTRELRVGIEIERKFLVDVARLYASLKGTKPDSVKRLSQWYFSSPETLEGGQKASVRVRTERQVTLWSMERREAFGFADDYESWLNIKSVGTGHTRQEYEYIIPNEDADLMQALAVGAIVTKDRVVIKQGGLKWEIDFFLGENKGLAVAEIELPCPDYPFEKPEWLLEEVTDELRYTNVALSSRPFKSW